MVERSVSLRLGVSGKAEVKAELQDIGATGEQQINRWSKASEKAGRDIDAAIAAKARAEQKLAAIVPQTPTQQAYQAGASTNYDGPAARDSAAAIKELLTQEELLDARARALTAVMEPLRVAQQRYDAEVRNVAELHDTGRISIDQFVAAEERAAAALARVSGQMRTADEAMAALNNASKYSAAPDTAFVGKSAAESAAAMQELLTQEEALTQKANALRAAIDPAWAAQQRFDREIGEARTLISAGAISLDDYVAKLRIEQKALDDVSTAQARGGTSAGAHAFALHNLSFQLQDTFTQISMGANPLSVIAIQGGQAAGAFAGMGGAAGKVADFMLGPWGLALTGGALAVSALVGHLNDGASASDQMRDHQQLLATIIDQTTGKINEQSKALLLNAAAMSTRDAKSAQSDAAAARRAIMAKGENSLDFSTNTGAPGAVHATTPVDPQLKAALDAFAKGGSADQLSAAANAIGKAKPQLKAVTDEILSQAAAYVTADRQAQQYQAQTRLLTGTAKPGDQRTALGQFGPEKPDLALADARAKLAAATSKSDKAEAQATITRIQAKKAYDDGSIGIDEYTKRMTAADAAVNAAREHVDKHAQTLAREAQSMEVSASAAIDVANAYLKSTAAGIQAEVVRKAATDATKKGIDVDAQAARQLALDAASAVAASAKSVAQMNDESAAREAVMAQVRAGTLSTNDMNVALAEENALRPLLALRARLHGDALETLNRDIDAQTAALKRRNAADADWDADQTIAKLKASGALTRTDAGFADMRAADRAIAEARARAEQEADLKKYSPDKRSDYVTAAVDDAQAKVDADRARYLADMRRSQQDGLTLGAAELQLVTANNNTRQATLDKLRTIIDLDAHGVDLASLEGQARLATVAALDQQQAKLKVLQDAWSEVKSSGEQFLDDLANPDGSGLKNLLRDIENEFIKLAALNPLKNLLFGEKLPTLSSVFSLFGSGGSTITNPTVDLSWVTAHNATGTQNWSGGMTYVNENGPEIMDLPGGTRIYPAAESRRMMQAADNGGGTVNNHFHLEGAVVTQDLLDQMNGIVNAKVTAGVPLTLSLSKAQAKAAANRKLGRRW